MRVRAAFAVTLLLACAACTKKKSEVKAPGRVITLDTDVPGLSGLTRDEHGALWAPGERGRAVVRIDPDTFGVTRYAVQGAPEGTDLEAMAWIDGVDFILGTETQERGRLRDVILDGRLAQERFAVAPIGNLEYARWHMTAPDNHGIEGVCSAGGALVFATELVETKQDRRWAPLGVFDPAVQAWTAHRVALTTKTGKLSGLDCRMVEGTIQALAIERHFGVSRLLRFSVVRGPESQSIEPVVAADLAELITPLPNFEGLTWLPDGSAVLVTDNRYRGRVEGPSQLFFIPASVMR
ncbi:MAG: esterase-like activity of phytase family protein [Myxococcales bacterium]